MKVKINMFLGNFQIKYIHVRVMFFLLVSFHTYFFLVNLHFEIKKSVLNKNLTKVCA
jgi:hypothetical protein